MDRVAFVQLLQHRLLQQFYHYFYQQIYAHISKENTNNISEILACHNVTIASILLGS